MLDLGRLIRSRTGERTLLNRFGRFLAPANIRWNQSLTSNYDNTAYIPGLGYQWGLGSITSFRGLDEGRLATTAGRVRRLTAGGGVNLPFAISLTSNFEDGTTETWSRRSRGGLPGADHDRPARLRQQPALVVSTTAAREGLLGAVSSTRPIASPIRRRSSQ